MALELPSAIIVSSQYTLPETTIRIVLLAEHTEWLMNGKLDALIVELTSHHPYLPNTKRKSTMSYRHLSWLILVLFQVACAEPQRNGFRVEGEPTTLQIHEIQEAIDEWCYYGHCAWLGDGNLIVRMVETMPESAMPGTIGFHELSTDGESSRISILKGFSSKEVPIRKTMLHELGHHWGCKNKNEPGEDAPGFVMSMWTDEQPNHLTPEDVACATR